jgi:hypothetical protein
MAARRPRRSGYNDGQLSLDSLWAEPEPERDEQVRKARDEPLAENRPGPLRGDPGAEGDFFAQLGEQAEREIQQLEDAIAGSDPPNEDYLTKVGRLNAARQAAQERVLAELILIPSPDSTQQPDPDGPAKTILQDVLEAIEQADQEPHEEQ